MPTPQRRCVRRTDEPGNCGGRTGSLERRLAVLKAIVEEHVRSARPVASGSVARLADLPVSSATIRNDMAALESDGLIVQPHASAGRVPSTRGYRRFVDELMGPARLSVSERTTILHQFHQIEGQASEWLALATTVLTRLVRSAAVAAAPHRRSVRVRDVRIEPIGPHRLHIVLVLDRGRVATRLVEIEALITDAWLEGARPQVTEAVRGKLTRQLAASVRGDPIIRRVIRTISEMARAAETQSLDASQFTGIAELLRQPEFGDIDRTRSLVGVLETGALVHDLQGLVKTGGGVRVVIGGESRLHGVRDLSVVLASFGDAMSGVGFVAVLGPRRLPYRRAIASVDTVSSALNGLVASAAA